MIGTLYALFTPLLLAAFSVGQVDYTLDKDIYSCKDLQCSNQENSIEQCNIIGHYIQQAGMTRVPDSSIEGLSWVEGTDEVNETSLDDGRHWHKSFFLGLPPDDGSEPTAANASAPALLPEGIGGCALFFTNVTDNVTWANGHISPTSAMGTCEEAMSSSCVGALVRRAREDYSPNMRSGEFVGPCDSLINLIGDRGWDGFEECEDFITQSDDEEGWKGLEVVDLSEKTRITAQTNGTTDCWPITPRGFDLGFVKGINTTGTSYADSVLGELYGIYPILTVLYPDTAGTDLNASDLVVSEQEAHLTCIKPIEGAVGDEEGADPGMANRQVPAGWRVMLATALGVVISGFL